MPSYPAAPPHPYASACRRLHFTRSLRLSKWLLAVETILSILFCGLLVSSARSGYIFNLLLALVTLINAVVALLVLRRLARSISASALVAHALWKTLQLILLVPSATVLTIALIKEGHIGDSNRSPDSAVLILSVCWSYSVFVVCSIGHLARLGRRLWKRKAAAGYPFSRASSVRSVISYISADITTDADDASLSASGRVDGEKSRCLSTIDCPPAPFDQGVRAADAIPLVVPMTQFPHTPPEPFPPAATR